MNSFDHFMKHSLNIRYYGRYVDDFVIVHPDKDYLKNLIPVVRNFLWNELGLKLHARKIYLQHYSKGVKYLGAVIKPYRIHTANRTIENFYNAVHKQNSVLSSQHPVPTYDEQSAFLSCLNSYLGFMKHYNSYKSRTRIIKKLSELWWYHVAVTNHASKFLSSHRFVSRLGKTPFK